MVENKKSIETITADFGLHLTGDGHAIDVASLVADLPNVLREGIKRIVPGELFVFYSEIDNQAGFDCSLYTPAVPGEQVYSFEGTCKQGDCLVDAIPGMTSGSIASGGGYTAEVLPDDSTDLVSNGTICFDTSRLSPSQGFGFVIGDRGDGGYNRTFFHPREMIPICDGLTLEIPKCWKNSKTSRSVD